MIHPGPQNLAQIREWLRAADEKLEDAQNGSVSKGTRMDAAYDVVLCCGLAVLSAQGWRASSEPGHHAEVLETMAAALGLRQAQFDELDAVRGWRHRKYRGALSPQDSELKTALDWARRIHERTESWLAANHSRLLRD